MRRLEERLDPSLREHELDHLREHSVELHVNILQHLHDGRAFEIIPILCPSPVGPTGTRPFDGRGPDLNDFADALHDELAVDQRPTLVIASADLSHVGTPFGESRPATPELMQKVADWDQSLLRDLEAGEADRFLGRVQQAANPTRICSVGNLYVLARVLRGRDFRVLRYHQASDFQTDTHVSCAAGLVT